MSSTTQHPSLEAVERALAEQDERLNAIKEQLQHVPEDVLLTLDEEWKEQFEHATEIRSTPAPLRPMAMLRV